MDEKMMLFLGTGAAEGIPTPFCRCRVCENARKKGGKEVRIRSSFRVSRELLIDLGPDLFSGCVKTGTDLYDLKYVLITHTHEDHLDIGNLFLKPMIHRGNGEKLHIYLNGEAFRFWSALEDRMEYEKREAFFKESLKENFVLHRLEFYHKYRIGEFEVIPVKGEHPAHFEKNAAGYLIRQKDGTEFLYALDTGYYSEETLNFLSSHRLDLLILECTFGSAMRGDKPYSHLDLHSCIKLCDRLYEQGTLTEGARVYLTHINQEQEYTHEELAQLCRRERQEKPYQMYAAYDGLKLTQEKTD